MMKTFVTKADVFEKIKDETYYIFPGTTVTTCLLTLENGTKVLGVNYGAIDPERHDWEQGRLNAYEDAFEKIWELEGYLLREKLTTQKSEGN